MKTLSTTALAAALLLLLTSSNAHARGDDLDYVPASSGKRYTPISGPELRVITGATVGVPLFLDTDRAVVRPGGEMNAWVGLDIGWLVFSGGFGASWTPIDLNAVAGGEGFGRSPLARIYLMGEMRFQVPVNEAVLPFLGVAFDSNWWRHRDSAGLDCGIWYCNNRSSFSFAPGFSGKVGIGIKVGRRIYLDVGGKISLTGSGDFFDDSEWFVTPFMGITYRGDPD